MKNQQPSRAQISRTSLQRLYIAMRHLFTRGSYKPLGVSGEAMIDAMKSLEPEIYGSMNDPERVELSGLLYIFQRLPQGIEDCRYIKLISREGFESSDFEALIPSKRRRNCYRIDEEQMFVEMTRGRSDIYDILTHLTFMYMEAEKIRRNSLDSRNRPKRAWTMLEKVIHKLEKGEDYDEKVAITYLSTILGRDYIETSKACKEFMNSDKVNDIFRITYGLGRLSMDEHIKDIDREISFSSGLREKLGHHIYGELWANNIHQFLYEKDLLDRPIHIISANMHSVMNAFFAQTALGNKVKADNIEELARILSQYENKAYRDKVEAYALKNGMYQLDDQSGTNISVQVFDCATIELDSIAKSIFKNKKVPSSDAVILVMDYAFGEQAFETMDELLKPLEIDDKRIKLQVESINIMGKAGILEGGKGDIMIATAHVFEGTTDNYPFDNVLSKADFKNCGLNVYEGPMISVLGTSLQNRDILRYFLNSSWNAIGLEMEGAHYQKAIQSAAKIRKNIREDVKLRYAYYASDNPLETGGTLASGSLGMDGVKSTYLITTEMLKGILDTK